MRYSALGIAVDPPGTWANLAHRTVLKKPYASVAANGHATGRRRNP
ncbi:MAG: hypothetical protein LAO51_00465 [Acidobacteriia bacterium]|nr:hypothetical protein [Terriglobia bacterium]